jgi:hypothetical protein
MACPPFRLLSALGFCLAAWGCGSDSFEVQADCQARGLSAGADRTEPSVAFVHPGAGSTLSGVVALTATATDNCEVTAVRFTIYGATGLGNGSPAADGHTYTLNWDSRAAGNGPITLAVYADDNHRDLEGNPTPNSGFQSREFVVTNP